AISDMADEQQQPNGDRMDRVERGLDHLLDMQAKHEAAAESRFRRIEAAAEARFETLTEALIRLTGVVEHLAEAQRAYGEETDRRFRNTDERLNALIKVVDGIIRKPPPEA
ncbi:MAG: hypothetical protein GY953_16165, partial [bacterium]|nr:hypothetical protein [bacterium]